MTPPQPPRLARSLAVLWERLHSPAGAREIFDVVIVGSGYGASAAAARLAGALVPTADGGSRAARVCLLERGLEYLPGEFPARFGDLPGHVRIADPNTGQVRANHEGLFDVRLGDDVVALVANGLGGGSLINAGVLLTPEPPQPADGDGLWPLRLAQLQRTGKFRFMQRWLGAQGRDGSDNTIDRFPGDIPKKSRALKELARPSEHTWAPISVSARAQSNAAGVPLAACTQCGDCMTGCNVGAKDSLDANLLRLAARRPDFEAYTGATVGSLRRSLAPHDGFERHWVLRVAHTRPELQAREADVLYVRAHKVVLAAGALGSPEILLRSRSDKLVFSSRLGERFSCNGDNIAAVHRMAAEVNPGAVETTPVSAGRAVGPTITGSVRIAEPGRRPFLLQEFAVPAALKRLFDETVTTGHVLNDFANADKGRHTLAGNAAQDPLAVDPSAMRHTLLVGSIGHDDAAGTLYLSNMMRPKDRPAQQGVLGIRWPDARKGLDLEHAHTRLQHRVESLRPATTANGAEQAPSLVPNPMWRMLPPRLESLVSQPRGPVLTVHPLGGCTMGVRAKHGVVDAKGRVFQAGGRKDDLWFGSLVVLDGSIVPGSLGVNPALTIATVALDSARRLRRHWKWGPPGPAGAPAPREHAAPPPHTTPGAAPGATEVQVVERLTGAVRLHVGATLPRDYVAELTLAYAPTQLERLMTTLGRSITVPASDPNCRLRLFSAADWDDHELRVASDAERLPYVRYDAPVCGSLRFLHREPSRPWWRVLRSLLPYLRNRGLRDAWQAGSEWLCGLVTGQPRMRPSRAAELPPPGIGGRIKDALRLASRAGEVRRFDYRLTLLPAAGPFALTLPAGGIIRGHKRLTYNCRANPWQQLTELQISQFPALAGGWAAPVFKLDLRFLAQQRVALLRIVHQADHANALADLGAFALYLARVIVSIHLWTFRKPDTPIRDEPQRLPGPVAGLPPPEITELEVDRPGASGEPVKVRLTRYPKPDSEASAAPLVMIHGYSVSGNTFTHPALQPSAAAWFWHDGPEGSHRGREVWVLDLRTSTGMATATEAWAMEQPALIDIPAALLHIRNVTGQRVDVLAHCIGCVMLSMALLTDARQVRGGSQQLGVTSWLTTEHLGLLTAFNGDAPDGGEHPCVRRIVLSQKGPLLRYTDANVLRAYLMQYLRRLLFADEYHFRPPKDPSVGDELLDRLLASLPYPPADYDTENPRWPWQRTPWVASRHRMDALYGRDFNAENLSPAALHAIDDLFGPINLDTVAQSIHFARFNAITNQRGRGEFVTLGQLRARWSGIPTLAVHGRDNGLADVSTQSLLTQHMEAAGVMFEAHTFDGIGHQDSFIGRDATQVLKHIAGFLHKELPAHDSPKAPAAWVFHPPWLGPRLHLPSGCSGVQVAGMSRPDQGRSCLILVPAHWPANREAPQPWDQPGSLMLGTEGGSDTWLAHCLQQPALDALGQAAAAAGLARPGWLVLHRYPLEETTATEAQWQPRRRRTGPVLPAATASAAPAGPEPTADPVSQMVRRIRDTTFTHRTTIAHGPLADLLTPPPQGKPAAALPSQPPAAGTLLQAALRAIRHLNPEARQRCFVTLADLQRALKLHTSTAPTHPLTLALGSCQYPAGLLDTPVAEAGLAELNNRLPDIDLVLFAGDQIYADATAGLADPLRSDERYDQPYERALRLAPMRALMRQRPVQMLPDDHELVDNWEPYSAKARKKRRADAKARDDTRQRGLSAFFHYQRLWPRRQAGKLAEAGNASMDFRFSGHPFFLLDTRTDRQPRHNGGHAGAAHLIGLAQRVQLECWLLAHRDAVKFIVTPSLLLPPRRQTLDELATPWRQGATLTHDGWDGYPASLAWLLEFLVINQVRHTVFLSGDEHHAVVCQATLGGLAAHPPVTLVSVHGSALYAPYPFANGRPEHLLDKGRVRIGRLDVDIKTTFAPPGDGFVHLALNPGPTPQLQVGFCKAGGAMTTTPWISL